MVKFGLTWLGGILALYGLADIIYETFVLVSWYGDTTLEQRNEFYEWLETDEATADSGNEANTDTTESDIVASDARDDQSTLDKDG